MKNAKCLICGSEDFLQRGNISVHSLMECRGCRLQFLDPVPDNKCLDSIYADYYKTWNLDDFQHEVSAMKAETFRNYLSQIHTDGACGRLLDVGCATGELLSVAERFGYDIFGIEISPYGIKQCRELFGDNKIQDSYLKKGDFPDDYFDVITLSDVFEHIANPREFLDILCSILKPEGTLMIVTPDTSSWTMGISGRLWPHYKTEHLFYYNRRNISKLLSGYFHEVNVQLSHKALSVQYVANVLNGYSNNRLIKSAAAGILKYLPKPLRVRTFKINIGEMFVLCSHKLRE
ncbi:class I SAM-dependent methyltransferase [Candidatus Magnetomonas plexicatena]|uniref:class I SAM-dependent methyltransferase n=1 Tax=Candidatus Magnetomonas plexicatena TaxID=2552947 RepID=UPI001C787434|nr:class I SAM-dependent methyltransferase [Nitrospirales bacterium LBB_01]